jgi:hypothetical protein
MTIRTTLNAAAAAAHLFASAIACAQTLAENPTPHC